MGRRLKLFGKIAGWAFRALVIPTKTVNDLRWAYDDTRWIK